MDDYDYEAYYNFKKQHEIACRVILTGVTVIASAASLFLAITILRFKRLRTRTNIYIVHLAILNSLYNVGIVMILLNIFQHHFILFVQMSLVLIHFTFTFLLALDWFVTATKPNWMIYYQRFYKYIFLCIYLLALIVSICIATVSQIPYSLLAMFLLLMVYFALVLFQILMNVIRDIIYIKPTALKTEYGFTVANIIIFSYMPCLFHHFVYLASIFASYTYNLERFFYFITFLPYILWIGHPVLVVYFLGRLNKHFKIAYLKSFGRTKGYSQEDLDALYLDDVDVNNSSTMIRFSNGQQTTVSI